MKNLLAPLDRLADFDEIVDVRTPLEFTDDHIPGALNAPVLSNEERVLVGTMYAQVSPFEATRVGAAIVARNMAQHLDTTFADRPRNWRPLIYCWRGGNRSGSVTAMFNMIGWQARQLEGGYKTYRRATLSYARASAGGIPLYRAYRSDRQRQDAAAARVTRGWRADAGSGATGGASRLAARRVAGRAAAVAEMVRHAAGRCAALLRPGAAGVCRSGEPAYRRGFAAACAAGHFHRGACVEVEASREDRATFLLHDYAHLFHNTNSFKQQLSKLIGLHSRERINGWHKLIDEGRGAELARELIDLHYDPAYARSSRQHFSELPRATRLLFRPNDTDVVEQARALLARLDASRSAETPPVTSA